MRPLHGLWPRQADCAGSLHHLRHTAARLLWAAGASDIEVQIILGHADIETSRRLYSHLLVDAADNAAAWSSSYVRPDGASKSERSRVQCCSCGNRSFGIRCSAGGPAVVAEPPPLLLAVLSNEASKSLASIRVARPTLTKVTRPLLKRFFIIRTETCRRIAAVWSSATANDQLDILWQAAASPMATYIPLGRL